MAQGSDQEDRVLAEGRETEIIRPDGRIPIAAVGVDLHNTLFSPRGGRSHAQLVKDEAQKLFGKFDVDADVIARATRIERMRHMQEFLERGLKGYEQWGIINNIVYPRLGIRCSIEAGQKLSKILSGTPELYHVRRLRRLAFRWLFEVKFPFKQAEGCFVVIASNTDQFTAQTLVNESGFKDHIDYIMTADKLEDVYKPSRLYFPKIFSKIGIPPEQWLIVGNSPFHDAVASLAGAHTVLFRDKDETLTDIEMRSLLGEAERRVHWARGLETFKKVVDERFVRLAR
jgi:FMN phosphatase YigB (HAD superfamily)